MTDDDRPDLTPAQRRDRATAHRDSARRLRRAADLIDHAIARPTRHPLPAPGRAALQAWHDDRTAYLLAVYAHRPALGRAAARQYRDLADAQDRRAAHLTRSTT